MNIFSTEKKPEERVTITPIRPNYDDSRKMNSIVWNGKLDVIFSETSRPLITDSRDIILKVTSTSICGSDLHLYSNSMPEMHKGDILGHEFMGIIEDIGDNVKKLKKGERVVVSFVIICGQCDFCKREEYTGCERTNPSMQMEKMYGHRTAALFGYSHLTGGVPGGQAEYVRVPLADWNCLPVPDDLPDEKALFLSDIIPTSYHGVELCDLEEGDTVAIWGLGPIGLLTARWCQIKKAKKVIGIDNVPERLEMAVSHLGIDVIDFSKNDVISTIKKLCPSGVDCAIECAGFEYPKTLTHKIERALNLETDTSDIFNEMFTCVRTYGRVSVIGVYSGYANHFPVGAMMEKHIQIRGGQCPVQKYWNKLLEKVKSGEFDPTFVVNCRGKLSDAPMIYKKMYNREDGILKSFLTIN